MSYRNNCKSLLVRVCALIASFALVGADVIAVPAQNANSSTTMNSGDAMMQSDNSNMSGNMNAGRRSRRGRRGRRRSNSNMSGNMSGEMNANMSGDASTPDANTSGNANMSGDAATMQNGNMSGDTSGSMNTGTTTRRGRRRGRRNRAMAGGDAAMAADTGAMAQTGAMASNTGGGTDADLSGTYSGTINYPDGGMTGDATLTITGRDFTLMSGGQSATGTVTAVTTRGYTGASMRFGTDVPAKIVSVRARKTGDRLTLTNVKGETHEFSFNSGRGGATAMGGSRRGRRTRRGRRGAMMADTTGATPMASDATNATTPDASMSGNMSNDQSNANMAGDANSNMSGEMNSNMSGGNMNAGRRGRRSRRGRRGGGNSNMSGNMSGDGNMNMSGNMNMNTNGNVNTNTPPPTR